MKAYIEQIKRNWLEALRNRISRRNLIFGLLAVVVLAVFTYYFFDFIENRKGGVVMNDWVLRQLPAMDVSIPIVFLEVSVILLFSVRSLSNPSMLITFLLAYTFILITRNITIGVTEPRPPARLIELKDPLAGIIYRTKSINRDLFYSGHVSLLFLFFLCSTKMADKYYMLIAAIAVGILLLIQHVHYTVDIICAPFFAYGCFWLSKKIPQFSPDFRLSKV